MALDLPDNALIVSQIEIAAYLKEDGDSGVCFGHEGLDSHGAIGLLQAVLDRMREERKYEWDTCPQCLAPWESHFSDDEADDDEL